MLGWKTSILSPGSARAAELFLLKSPVVPMAQGEETHFRCPMVTLMFGHLHSSSQDSLSKFGFLQIQVWVMPILQHH
jgi:hypothetical protein